MLHAVLHTCNKINNIHFHRQIRAHHLTSIICTQIHNNTNICSIMHDILALNHIESCIEFIPEYHWCIAFAFSKAILGPVAGPSVGLVGTFWMSCFWTAKMTKNDKRTNRVQTCSNMFKLFLCSWIIGRKCAWFFLRGRGQPSHSVAVRIFLTLVITFCSFALCFCLRERTIGWRATCLRVRPKAGDQFPGHGKTGKPRMRSYGDIIPSVSSMSCLGDLYQHVRCEGFWFVPFQGEGGTVPYWSGIILWTAIPCYSHVAALQIYQLWKGICSTKMHKLQQLHSKRLCPRHRPVLWHRTLGFPWRGWGWTAASSVLLQGRC